ncbi:P-type ATPase of 2 isoform 1 [Capsicum annuum]|nr:P-type ATPase of 2 isoform 1 [Capsicum annuum]
MCILSVVLLVLLNISVSFSGKEIFKEKEELPDAYDRGLVAIADIKRNSQKPYQNLGNLSHHNFAAVLPGDSVAGIVVANGVINFLNIYNSLLVVRLVLTWFPNAPPAIVSPLSTLCDPYLNIFRGIIPPLGGTLDLSPILAFLVLNAFTSTASALPAELPSTTVRASSDTSPRPPLFHLTTSQKKWMRRLAGNKAKTADGES